jgi:hypothetical protein
MREEVPEVAETACAGAEWVVEVVWLVAIAWVDVEWLGVDAVVELLEEPPQPAASSATATGPTASNLRARAPLESSVVTAGLVEPVIVRSFAGRLVDVHSAAAGRTVRRCCSHQAHARSRWGLRHFTDASSISGGSAFRYRPSTGKGVNP